MSELGVGAQELESLLQFFRGRRSAVEIVVDRQDGGRVGEIELALLLLGEVQGVEGAAIRSPCLLGGKQDGQAHAEGLRPFPLKPPVDSHRPLMLARSE